MAQSQFLEVFKEAEVIVPYSPGTFEHGVTLARIADIVGDVDSMSLESRSRVARVAEVVISASEIFPDLVDEKAGLMGDEDINTALARMSEIGMTDLSAFNEGGSESYTELFGHAGDMILSGLTRIRRTYEEYLETVRAGQEQGNKDAEDAQREYYESLIDEDSEDDRYFVDEDEDGNVSIESIDEDEDEDEIDGSVF